MLYIISFWSIGINSVYKLSFFKDNLTALIFSNFSLNINNSKGILFAFLLWIEVILLFSFKSKKAVVFLDWVTWVILKDSKFNLFAINGLTEVFPTSDISLSSPYI